MNAGKAVLSASKQAIFFVIFLLIIFLGCAKKEAIRVQAPNGEGLKERVMAYCGYLANQEFDKAYSMEYPLYKKNVSLTQYIRKHTNSMMAYEGCEVSGLQEDGDDATVDLQMKVSVRVPGAKAFQHSKAMSEKWVRINGEWYHVAAEKKNAPTRDFK